MERRVLFVAYNYPPVGGAGVQRTTKFIKYLPEYGWRASVLTVANPSVPVLDHSLDRDIPSDTIVCRARTLEPGYRLKQSSETAASNGSGGLLAFGRQVIGRAARQVARLALQPDAQVLWLPDAVRQGRKLLRQVPHAAILVTAPPFSSFFVGAALSRRSGVPLVLDYRDEWTISNAYWENKRPGPLSTHLQEAMQRRIRRQAHAVIASTRASGAALGEIARKSGSAARIAWIYNGFDRSDFPPAHAHQMDPQWYRLAYIGTLWNLTNVAPLVEGVRQLAASKPHLASHLELIFAGRRTDQQQQHLQELRGLPCRVVEHPYLDHSSAMELLASCDGLCVLLADVPQAQRVVPGKLFECIAARKPILAIAPRGEVWELLADHPAADLLEPAQALKIADALARQIQRHLDGVQPVLSGDYGERFERRAEAGELARLLNSLESPAQHGDFAHVS